MKYELDIDLKEDKAKFVEEFLNSISFVKNIKNISSNEITNPSILTSIEDYENGKQKATPLNLQELKEYVNA
jgi:hypothetical protein